MQYSLMQAIFNYMIRNRQEFQLVNTTVDKYRPYIYDEKGEHLIGGEQVYQFILDSHELIKKAATR